MNIQYYCDPGHGWMKVKRSLLIELGIADKISGYSYQRDDMAYLEEDCDAGLLLRTLDSRGIKWTLKQSHSNKSSRIRNYRRYEVAA